ncbi:MAG: hypothetical protein JWO52_7492 [Gammaproteobacteria bacterium]|nr:hypothetical protein [Gammaproteobacteria bacterium]
MPLNLEYLRKLALEPVETVLTDREPMLYALSIGIGSDPLNLDDLSYVYEKRLRVFPTMPVIIGHPGNWMLDPQTGITRAMVVHGGQRLWTYTELPIGRRILTTNKISQILDKGRNGAVVTIERETHDRDAGVLIARSTSSIFCRADGGFGGPAGPIYEFDPVPERAPDRSVEVATPANAALVYRLNQDRNPLHADPEVASKAGFPRPILHGLYTFGVAAVAVCGTSSGSILRSIETRFSKPAFPGETITVDLWKEADAVAFRARVAARDAIVLDRGRAVLA